MGLSRVKLQLQLLGRASRSVSPYLCCAYYLLFSAKCSATSRAVNVAGARENVGTPVVQKSGIQCYNCREYGHVSRECQKPKRVKDAAYHKEKMLLCKQEEVGVQLNAEQADWKDDTDDESDDQELEAHYVGKYKSEGQSTAK
ncbi:gag-pol polyprotein [Tanacetum coccineum]